MSSQKCWLKCAENTHEPILLKNGEELVIGRGPDTKIKDCRCSRTQVKFQADYKNHTVKVTQIGRNACGLNGLALEQNSPVTVKHGDRVEVLLGQYIHVIEFDPPPPSDSNEIVIEKEKSTSQNLRNNLISDSSDESDKEPEPKRSKGDSPSKNSVSSTCWESVDMGDLLIYTPEGVKPSSIIAAYDLDGTIIGTTTNSVFPKHKDDWKILYPEILDKLKEEHEKNYRIVFFTNQAAISTGKNNVSDFKKKVENVIKKINLPIQVFIATSYSIYRKPCIGMWEALMERNGNLIIDRSKSFYCGDAAGREAGDYGKKKDFSSTDLLFAKNLNLNFETPEHHFLKKKMPLLKISVFDPNTIRSDLPLCDPSWGQVISSKLEVIVLVGIPGSGKTTFAKTHLVPAGYVHVNRDTLGSWNKCVNVMEMNLRQKQRVVVDNTNPDIESRKRYIDVAKNYTSIVRCFIINTSFNHARHNNKFRQLTDTTHTPVTDVVLHTYKNKYEEPSTAEGFTEVIKINFWQTFKNPKLEKLYKLFLLEK